MVRDAETTTTFDPAIIRKSKSRVVLRQQFGNGSDPQAGDPTSARCFDGLPRLNMVSFSRLNIRGLLEEAADAASNGLING